MKNVYEYWADRSEAWWRERAKCWWDANTANMKLSARMQYAGQWQASGGYAMGALSSIEPRIADWAAEVAALEEQLLERQAECFVLGDELASARQWARAWKQAAKDNKWAFDVTVSFQEDYKEWVFALQDERDSARQWARAWKQAAKEFRVSCGILRELHEDTLHQWSEVKCQLNSARRVARALHAVYRVEADFRFGKIAYWDRWGVMAPPLAAARRVLAQEARDG